MPKKTSQDGLPAGWSISVRVRPTGKKDKHYFSPDGLKFNSMVEVARYLNTVPSRLKEGPLKGASAKPQGSPESEEKYYSAEEHPADHCGNATESASLDSEDGNIPKPVQQAENCAGEEQREAGEASAEDISPSPLEEAKSNIKHHKVTAECNSPQSKEVKVAKDYKSTDQMDCNSTDKGSHQLSHGGVEEKGRDTCGHVKQEFSLCAKEKKKTRIKRSANVGVERVVAEGLPDGWIKEIKVSKRNNSVRRDPYYIDPVSGYVFRSMKDALRYLATGEIGRLAFKRKEELDDVKTSSPLSAKDRCSYENETNIEDQRSNQTKQLNLDERKTRTKNTNESAEEKDEEACKSANSGKGMPENDNLDPSPSITDLSGSAPTNQRTPRQKKERKNAYGNNSSPADEVGVPQDVPCLRRTQKKIPTFAHNEAVLRVEMHTVKIENIPAPAESAGIPQDELSLQRTEDTSEEKPSQGTPKSRKRKTPDLPRRTSSRLAGVSADLGLEVTRTRAQLAAIRRLDDRGASEVITTTVSGKPQGQTTRAISGDKLSDPMTNAGLSAAVLKGDAKKQESGREANFTTMDRCEVPPQAKYTRRGSTLPESVTSKGMLAAAEPVDTEKSEIHQADAFMSGVCSQKQLPETESTRRGSRLPESMTVTGTSEAEADTGKLERHQTKNVYNNDCSLQLQQFKRTRRGNKLPDTMTCADMSAANLEEDVNKLGRYRVEAAIAIDRNRQQPQTKYTRRGSKLEISVGPSEAPKDQAGNEKKNKSTVLLPEENMFAANHAGSTNPGEELEDETSLPFELPSGDILSDPCIEFAIKTLTGIDFDACKSIPKPSNDSYASRGAVTLRAPGVVHLELERERENQQAAPEKSFLKAYNYEGKVRSEIPSSSSLSNLSLGDSWQDPCIEFAIKTLTGAIPVEYDLDMPGVMQQQQRSSRVQESSKSNVVVDNLCRTNLLWQHPGNASSDKTAYRQHSGVVATAPQPGNNRELQRTQEHPGRINK